ncbi:hypothetical protein BN135_695 [Cronobacter muytjensii 530]
MLNPEPSMKPRVWSGKNVTGRRASLLIGSPDVQIRLKPQEKYIHHAN